MAASLGVATLGDWWGFSSPLGDILLPRCLHSLMARRHWLLDSGPSGSYVPGQWHPWILYPLFSFVGGGFGSDGRVVPRCGPGVIFRGVTGSWILAILLALVSRYGVFP